MGGKSQAFSARLTGKNATLTTAGKTYRLKETAEMPASPEAPPASAAAATPAAPGTMELKRVELRDITMGGVVAHTMLIPADWKLEGHIEWSNDGTATWQNNFKVSGPNHEKIAAIPAMTFSYTESKRLRMPPAGTPPPQDLGAWIVNMVQQSNREVSDVQLVSDRRDPAAEAAQVEQHRELGMNTNGMNSEIHVVTIGYRRRGVTMREEIHANYTRLQPLINENIHSQTWMLFTNLIIAAPDSDFERLKSQLLAIAGTRQMVPKWWNQMFQVRGEIMRVKAGRIHEEIRRRGEVYDRISDEQFAAWKQSNARDNEVQRQRIQGIYEVQDYRDRDGTAVELPFHHKHVFSDGQGNYILTNDYGSKPGGNFEEIQAAR